MASDLVGDTGHREGCEGELSAVLGFCGGLVRLEGRLPIVTGKAVCSSKGMSKALEPCRYGIVHSV